MKNKIILCLALFASLMAYGQAVEPFKIQKDGVFLTEEGKNYQVVEFEGKTAEELFDMVLLNATRMFIPPKDEINENKPANISIGWLFEIPSGVIGGDDNFTWEVRCYYTLTFKDGRIRVDAPRMDKYLVANTPTKSISLLFANAVNYCYDKKTGEINPKRVKRLVALEEGVNTPLKALLGIEAEW